MIKKIRPVLVLAGIVAAVAATIPAQAVAAGQPPLRLVAGSQTVTLHRYPGESVLLDLGVHLVTGSSPFEIRVTRESYTEPIVATQIVHGRARKLPDGLLTDFAGLPDFLHVTVTDAAGNVALETDQTFCPNNDTARTRPDAPDTSPYPAYCSLNPFTLGSVWGVQAGWATSATDWYNGRVDLAEGAYTAQISVAQRYRDLFGIPADQASVTIQVTVHAVDVSDPLSDPLSEAARSGAPQPNATRPAGAPSVPKGPRPDLRALPAWEIDIAPAEGRDYLRFAANVWNAGPSPLVLDGFRRTGEDIMDAYQYFYDADGNQVGYAPTGTMEWDAREGHHHWHFTDFASYRLLNATQSEVVRSQKEAFCLAATDAIDYTVPNANWNPYNTDLHTACGSEGSLAVREVLDVGSGDTYLQYLPGQSFDITDLPNGTYYVQVIANPDHNLYETDLTNNMSLREVILAGSPGERTVTVPPHGLIDTDPPLRD
ncbi:lysyl oxidase family protein [Actinophytocola sediminis]